MKSFNVICGLPRSGSTLLCNILNQNSEIYASSTSIVPYTVNSLVGVYSNSAEVKSLLISDRYKTELRISKAIKSMIEGWYISYKDKIIFDKARVWNNSSLLLKNLYPESLIVCMVRDPRNIVASVEKQHRKNPMFDLIEDPLNKTLYSRAEEMMSPTGIIGSCILGVEDLLRRNPSNLLIIRYEELVSDAENVLLNIYHRLKLKSYTHNFNDIENTSEDIDGLWLNKFEHIGAGKLVPTDPDEWRKYITEDLGELILNRYPQYTEFIGYKR